jgi:hypothetical protein
MAACVGGWMGGWMGGWAWVVILKRGKEGATTGQCTALHHEASWVQALQRCIRPSIHPHDTRPEGRRPKVGWVEDRDGCVLQSGGWPRGGNGDGNGNEEDVLSLLTFG